MKRVLLSSLFAVSLFACGPDAVASVSEEDSDFDGTESFNAELTSTSRSQTWFPLQTGNSWTFKSSTGLTRTITVSNAADGMALVTGLFAQPTWVGLTTDSATTLQQWNGSAWIPLVRFGYASTTWKTSETLCTGLIGRRTSTGTAITTTAGTFSDTRTISFAQVSSPTVLCAPHAFNELTFVPNVGLVSFRTGTGTRFNLVSAKVNGRDVPVVTAPNLVASVRVDRPSYTSTPNTIRCITEPCASNEVTAETKITFELRNTGSASQTWTFRSGCQFDAELLTSSGALVKTLSAERPCTLSLTSLTLNAGQSKSWTASMKLADVEGQQLEGTYSVKAKLIPQAGVAPSASTSLSVSILAP